MALSAGVLAFLFSGAAPTAHAQWGQDGNLVAPRSDFPAIVGDGAAGLFVLFRDVSQLEVRAQRLTPNGLLPGGWSSAGLDVSSAGGPQLPGDAALDGSGGAYFAWNGGYPGVVQSYITRLAADGARMPGWPELGRAGQFGTPTAWYYFPRLFAEDTSGVYVAWEDERYYENVPGGALHGIMVTRLTSDGALAPGWPESGADPCSCGAFRDQSGTGLFPGAAPEGGVVLTWNDGYSIRAQRFLRDGRRAPGWPTQGVAMGAVPFPHGYWPEQVCTDGGGGVFAAWQDFRESPTDFSRTNIYAAHTLADGRLDPRWPPTGLPVVTAPGEQQFPSLAPDGYGGCFLAWTDVPSQAQAFVLRLRDDGSVHPGWPAQGALISTRPGYLNEVEMAPDGMGGVFLVFEDSFGQYSYVQHLGANGQPAPGWTPEGRSVSPGLSEIEIQSTLRPDGQGGVYVVWNEGPLRAQHYGADGIVPVQLALEDAHAEPGLVRLRWWSPGAGVLSGRVWRRTEQTSWEPLGLATMQGPDALGYEDRSVGAGQRYAYQLRVSGPEGESITSEAWVTVPGAPRFALSGARPNPAHGSDLRVAFSLPHAAPAELALYDVSGRRVASRDVGALGAGAHVAKLAEGERIAPGLYWLRLSQGAERTTTRVVIAE